MKEKSINNQSAGKGDAPRNCFSKKYRDNYESINWKSKKNENITYYNDNSPPPKRRLSTYR